MCVIALTLLVSRHLPTPDTPLPAGVQAPPAKSTNTEEKASVVVTQKPEEAQKTQKESATSSQRATLEIEGAKYISEIPETITVYDFMDKLRREGKINFTEKNYTGLGKFIEEINRIKGSNGKFWIYYVNGKKAGTGVSNYKIHPEDVVTWKFEKEI